VQARGDKPHEAGVRYADSRAGAPIQERLTARRRSSRAHSLGSGSNGSYISQPQGIHHPRRRHRDSRIALSARDLALHPHLRQCRISGAPEPYPEIWITGVPAAVFAGFAPGCRRLDASSGDDFIKRPTDPQTFGPQHDRRTHDSAGAKG